MKDELSKSEWSYYDDMFPEGQEGGFNSDSDFDYDDNYTKKKTKAAGGKKGGSKPKTVSHVSDKLACTDYPLGFAFDINLINFSFSSEKRPSQISGSGELKAEYVSKC